MRTLIVWSFFISTAISLVLKGDVSRRDVNDEDEESSNSQSCKLPENCGVSLPQHVESKQCLVKRQIDTTYARYWYQLTVQGEKMTILFPLTFIPFLNQTLQNVLYHTAIDPFESRWLSLMSVVKTGMTRIRDAILAKMAKYPFLSYAEYKAAYHNFELGIKGMRAPQYFGNPATEETFTNIIDNNRWASDEIFVQRRFAGPCPFLIQRVTMNGQVGVGIEELKKQLNPDFYFDKALSRALTDEITLDEAVEEKLLYVLYHKQHNGLKSLPDKLDILNDSRHLMNVTSPITLFIRDFDGGLKVVAIQIDYTPESKVYTPESDPVEWQIAKAMADVSDSNVCQAMYHLSHIHFSSTIFCAVFRRHFSEQHPIYDVLKYHCEATTPQISVSYPALAAPEHLGHLFIAIGHVGFTKLSSTAYFEHYYGILDYDTVLNSRGLDDDDLEYHPFRDDGKVIWEELEEFAIKFVDIYYENDEDIAYDKELQSFANEVSIDGKISPDGGKGKLRGFPSAFETKEQLQVFVHRFIWHIVMHGVCNYPLEPYCTYVPLTPMKLYKDTRQGAAINYAYNLPDGQNTLGMTLFAAILGNTRINRIMDHYDKVQDSKLRKLVQTYHGRFHGCIQEKLEKRNAKRKEKDQLGFQYLEPKWLTNSVHI